MNRVGEGYHFSVVYTQCAYTSCAILLVKSSVVDAADGLAQSGGNVFSNLLVDPMSILLSGSYRLPSGDGWADHRTHAPRRHGIPGGIPGRHNGRRAGKRGRTRPPPLRRSCYRKHHQNVKDVPAEKPTTKKPSMLPPIRLARQQVAVNRHLQKLRRLRALCFGPRQ